MHARVTHLSPRCCLPYLQHPHPILEIYKAASGVNFDPIYYPVMNAGFYPGKSAAPPMHSHDFQEEIFTVKAGR